MNEVRTGVKMRGIELGSLRLEEDSLEAFAVGSCVRDGMLRG